MALAASACSGPGTPSTGPTSSPAPATLSPGVASPSIAPSPSTAAPTTGPSPTGVPSGALADRAIATVTVDRLNLRAGAGKSAPIVKVLKAGTRLFVVGEPALADGYRWHHVAVIDPDGCGYGCGDMGWVATPVEGAEAFLEQVAVACPASPVTAEEIIAMQALEPLHCYGDRDLTITGWVGLADEGYIGDLALSPFWLAAPDVWFFMPRPDGHPGSVLLHFAPGSVSKALEANLIIRATAHFDDPAASTCEAALGPDVGANDATLPSRDQMILGCRSNLVVTDFEVIGNLPDSD